MMHEKDNDVILEKLQVGQIFLNASVTLCALR